MPRHTATARATATGLEFHPLTLDRWPDLEALFGRHGAYGGCWCMWWRLPGSEYRRSSGSGNRRALRRIAGEGRAPGILAYRDGRPVGWCSVAPREEFMARLGGWTPFRRGGDHPALRSPGERAVWSIVCFFVDRAYRKQGVAERLLDAAVRHARDHGAKIIEAYPVDESRRTPDEAACTGTLSMFRRAGFREVVRAYPARPIVRRPLRPGPQRVTGRT